MRPTAAFAGWEGGKWRVRGRKWCALRSGQASPVPRLCRREKVGALPLLALFLTLSLLLVVAGDVETNPGPISGETAKH